MKRLCFCLCTALGILLFVLKKPIGISVLGLCAVLFVLSVCVNIFSKKKLSATLVSDGTGLKNKDMSRKFILKTAVNCGLEICSQDSVRT